MCWHARRCIIDIDSNNRVVWNWHLSRATTGLNSAAAAATTSPMTTWWLAISQHDPNVCYFSTRDPLCLKKCQEVKTKSTIKGLPISAKTFNGKMHF